MDGMELCRNIKANPTLSHIPIIVLTAKNDIESKLESLQLGVESFLEKPFSFQYLLALIQSLLESTRKTKEMFISKPYLPLLQPNAENEDVEFIDKLTYIINSNISDINLSVENIAEQLCMSRTNLHRKVKKTTGIPPIQFIRLIRLQKAAQLLQEQKYKVKEVCFLVGFDNVSYFAKLFQMQFGISPSKFEKQQE